MQVNAFVDFRELMYWDKKDKSQIKTITTGEKQKQITAQHKDKLTHTQTRIMRREAGTDFHHKVQEIFPQIDRTAPHGKWTIDLIAVGTPSLADQTATFGRMMAIVGKSTPQEITFDDILKYLHRCTTTCLSQSINNYLGQILQLGLKYNMSWANDGVWQLIRRGLRITSTERKHATPMTPTIFHELQRRLDLELGLGSTCAYLGGTRLDEIFRLRADMISIVKD